MSSLKEIRIQPDRGEIYYEYECKGCGKPDARNSYSEPSRTHCLERRLCFTCNHWFEFEQKLEKNYSTMTIIAGNIYSPGNRISGEFRGMAGRRFDIEYIESSIYARQRITTFDLWSGGAMPESLQAKWPDTARFLNGAGRHQSGETGCWNPSDHRAEPYPLPRFLKDLS